MASTKTLNAKNLEALGAAGLATLLMEVGKRPVKVSRQAVR